MLKFFENKGTSPMYVGSTMIPPGEGKLVEVLARKTAPTVAEPTAPNLDEILGKLLDGSLAVIVPGLPELTIEGLDRLEDLEKAGKNRKGLIDAIAAERIRRADEKLQAQQGAQAAQALEAARDALLRARVAQMNLPPDTPAAERAAADAVVAEAQAKVDALATPE